MDVLSVIIKGRGIKITSPTVYKLAFIENLNVIQIIQSNDIANIATYETDKVTILSDTNGPIKVIGTDD